MAGRMATALYKNTTISSLKHNNIISFDEKLGLIKVQSGLILKDLLEFIIPKGFCSSVSRNKICNIGRNDRI